MSSGAMIQFIMREKPIWIHICLVLNAWCSVSYLTLQRMGYIITNNPTAISH